MAWYARNATATRFGASRRCLDQSDATSSNYIGVDTYGGEDPFYVRAMLAAVDSSGNVSGGTYNSAWSANLTAAPNQARTFNIGIASDVTIPVNGGVLLWIQFGVDQGSPEELKFYTAALNGKKLAAGSHNITVFCGGSTNLQGEVYFGNQQTYAPEAIIADASTAPLAPTGLSAAISGAGTLLSWTGSAGATGYKVYRGTSPNPTTLHATLGDVSSYNDTTSLSAPNTYYYRIKATNSSGESDYSADTSVLYDFRLSSAAQYGLDGTQVTLTFNTEVDETSAENVANYSSSGLTVSSAVKVTATTVRLTFTSRPTRANHTVAVSGVTSLGGIALNASYDEASWDVTRKEIEVVGDDTNGYRIVVNSTDGGAAVHYHETDSDLTVYSGSTPYSFKYATKSVTDGVVTLTKTIASGFTVTTTLTPNGTDSFLVEHSFESTTNRTIRILRKWQGSITSRSMSRFFKNTDGAAKTMESQPFVFVGGHDSSDNVMYLLPGNGYENDWCCYNASHTADTSWYNKHVVRSDGNTSVALDYGLLASGSSSSYSCNLVANEAKTYSYVMGIARQPANVNQLLERVYVDYYNAYAPVERADKLKMVWSTAHQLVRIRKANDTEKVCYIVASRHYSPDYYHYDALLISIGLGIREYIESTLDLFSRLKNDDSGTASGSGYGPGSTLTGVNQVTWPLLSAYNKHFFDYEPSASEITTFTNLANSYLSRGLSAYNNAYMDFYDTGGAAPQYLWEHFGQAATSSFVTADGGVTPYHASKFAKIAPTSSAAGLKSYWFGVLGGESITLGMMLNLPNPLTNGVRLFVEEYGATYNLIGTTYSTTRTAATSGWQQESLTLTTNANTKTIRYGIEVVGADTVYADFATLTANGANSLMKRLFFSHSGQADGTKYHKYDFYADVNCWNLLQMRCLKELIGSNWTQQHEDSLNTLKSDIRANFYDAGSGVQWALCDPIRSDTLVTTNAWLAQFFMQTMFQEQIFTNAEWLDIYDSHPSHDIGTGLGDFAFRDFLIRKSGAFLGATAGEWRDGYDYEGYYQDGGSWLLFDGMGHANAYLAGRASAATSLVTRVDIEKYVDNFVHESIDTRSAESTYQTSSSDQLGLGWNVALLSETPLIPPTNVVATLNGASVDLSWLIAAANATGSYVERRVDGGAWEVEATINDPDIEVHTDSNLPASWYSLQYRVASFSGSTSSGWTESNTLLDLASQSDSAADCSASVGRLVLLPSSGSASDASALVGGIGYEQALVSHVDAAAVVVAALAGQVSLAALSQGFGSPIAQLGQMLLAPGAGSASQSLVVASLPSSSLPLIASSDGTSTAVATLGFERGLAAQSDSLAAVQGILSLLNSAELSASAASEATVAAVLGMMREFKSVGTSTTVTRGAAAAVLGLLQSTGSAYSQSFAFALADVTGTNWQRLADSVSDSQALVTAVVDGMLGIQATADSSAFVAALVEGAGIIILSGGVWRTDGVPVAGEWNKVEPAAAQWLTNGRG